MILLGKIVSWLFTPVTFLVIFTLVSWFKRRLPSSGKWWTATVVLWVFFTNPMIINWVFRWWEGRPAPLNTLTTEYEAAILLTGFLETPEIYDRPFLSDDGDRLMQTVNLFRAGKVKNILISGGKVFESEGPSEPELVRSWLLEEGIPDSCIWVENYSRNTFQSAQEVWKMIKEKPGMSQRNFLLVTSAYHMRRSVAMFRKTPLKFMPWSASFKSLKLTWHPTKWLIPSPTALFQWYILSKEWIGLTVYSLKS